MYILQEEPGNFRGLHEESIALSQKVLARLTPCATGVKVPADRNLLESPEVVGEFFVLKEGVLQYSRGGRVQCVFEEGDVLGLEQVLAAESTSELRSDFAVIIDCYKLADVYGLLERESEFREQWTKLLVSHASLFSLLGAAFQQEDIKFEPRIMTFEKGQKIIEQGSEGHFVYTLAEGAAEVFVNGVKVGELNTDEIFGAIAAITQTPRTATVVAVENCLVLALPPDKFADLVKSRPSTVKKLIEDMARKLVNLNSKVVELSEKA